MVPIGHVFLSSIFYSSLGSPILFGDDFILAVGGPVNLYNNQNFCFHLGMTVNGANEQCINPESFASFIGLLESIPLHDTGSDNGSFDSSFPDTR